MTIPRDPEHPTDEEISSMTEEEGGEFVRAATEKFLHHKPLDEIDQLKAQVDHYKSIVANHQCAQPQFLVEERDQLKAQVAALKLDNKCLANWINLPWLDANKKVMELQQQLDQAKAVICNGIHMSVNQADLLNDGKPIWRAIIFVDDQHRYNSLKVLE